MGVVGSLAAAQLRHRPGRWGLLVVGVALAAAIPVIAAGAGQSVAAQTVRTAVEQMAPGDRTVTVIGTGTIYDPQEKATFNALAREQLARLSSAPVRREVVFHQISFAGATYFLGGADDLSTAVRVVAGRLPRSCTPRRCEVVAIGGNEQTLARATRSLGLVVVGRAVRTDPTVLSGELDPGREPLLLGNGADSIALLSSLSLFGRTYGWVTRLDVDRVIALGAPAYVRRSTDVANTLIAKVDGAAIIRPDTVLINEYDRASLSARRFDLLGGTAAVLLLGFAVVAAVGLRREHAVLVAVLRRRGARMLRITWLTALEAIVACIAGALLGCVIGGAVTTVLVGNAGLPAWRSIWHALGSAGLATALLSLAAVAVTVGVLLAPDRDRRAVWRGVEFGGIACLGAALLAASRGSASASSLASGSDPLVVALPVLSAVVGGLLAARLWAPLARLAERLAPRRSVAGRIGLLGAIRRPLRPVATVAFLTAAVASVVFAGAYRATLLDGAIDQAAFAVPMDATLTGGRDVPNPLAVTSTAKLDGIAPGVRAYGLVRNSAVIRYLNGDSTGIPLLGIDPSSLPAIHRWSRVTGTSASAAAVADELRPRAAQAGTAPTVPAGAHRLSVTAAGLSPALDIELWLASADGREAPTRLQQHSGIASGPVPDLGGGELHAIGLSLTEDIDYATHHQHAIGEGNTDQPVVAGTASFGAVSADGRPVPWAWAGWGSANAQVTPQSGAMSVRFRLEGSQVVVMPNYGPTPTLPVVVDPATASTAQHGQLMLSLDEVTVTAQVVGVVDRFPAAGASAFAIADRNALAPLLDQGQPGTGATTELWVAAPAHSRPTLQRALSGAPYDQLTVALREPIQDRLVADPVARGSRVLLAVIAGLALLVAAVSLVLLVLGERRDDAGELYAWEADGLRPATLRRVLFLRALSVVAVALPLGLATGLVLARVGTTLVAVDGSGEAPNPPLQVAVGAAWTALILLIGVGVGVIVSWLVASRMLRERLPVSADLDLR